MILRAEQSAARARPRALAWTAVLPSRLANDSLLRNSFYLALNAGTQAGVGFIFWLLCSRLFNASEVGIATTMISGATVISLFSLFGFNSTFVRFLPTSQQRDDEINTGLLVVFLAALVVTGMYLAFVPVLVPKLGIIRESAGFALGFVLLTAFSGVNLVTDSVFIAFRKAQYNVVVDGVIQGAVKLALPAFVVGLGAYAMFMAWGLGAMAAVLCSVLFMMRSLKYRPKLRVSMDVLRRTWHYSAANYIANLLALSPALIIPLIVLDVRGPRDAAFYFMAYQVANVLFSVGSAISLSFFAEGSHDEADLPSLLRRAGKIVGVVCVPCGILIAVTAHWVLLVFGHDYSAGGAWSLGILALASPFVALFWITLAALRISGQLKGLVLTGALYAIIIVGLALPGAHYGLQWVAVAFLIGTGAAAALAASLTARHLRSLPQTRTADA